MSCLPAYRRMKRDAIEIALDAIVEKPNHYRNGL
jgi:hypothetical protein